MKKRSKPSVGGMATFNPAVFFSKHITRNDWLPLTKSQLLEIATFQDIDVPGSWRKPEIVDFLIKTLKITDVDAHCLEMAKLEVESKKEETKLQLARLEIEREKIRTNEKVLQRKHENRFDLSSCLRIMPKFNPDDVDVFFDAFEKVATELDWPKEKWPVLVQSAFVGKAQEAYAALDVVQSTDYKVIKKVVLQAYEIVPEGYRQRFRSLRRKPGETFLELARQQEGTLDRWLRSSESDTYASLKELVLLEQFKSSVPRPVEMYLNSQNVTDLRQAALLADSYELTQGPRGASEVWPNHPQSPMISPQLSRPFVHPRDIICHYCKRVGHMKFECPALAQNSSAYQGKPMSLVQVGRDAGQVGNLQNGHVNDVFGDFVSTGALCVTSGGEEVPVTILRDTGAAQSVVCAGVLELPPCTSLNRSVLLKGLGGEFQAVPLHKLYLKCNLVAGEVVLGVVPSLPVEGVHVLLGNDLAQNQVYANSLSTDLPDKGCNKQAVKSECREGSCSGVDAQGQISTGVTESEPSPVELEVELGDTSVGQLLGEGTELECTREQVMEEPTIATPLTTVVETAAAEKEVREVTTGLAEPIVMQNIKVRPMMRQGFSVCFSQSPGTKEMPRQVCRVVRETVSVQVEGDWEGTVSVQCWPSDSVKDSTGGSPVELGEPSFCVRVRGGLGQVT